VFADGSGFDEVLWTPAGAIWVTAVVRIIGRHLELSHVMIYPTTGSELVVGVLPMLNIARMVLDQAKQEGFISCRATAERKRPGKPGRIIELEWRFR
jgi:hypothetical protein